ncbi:MAG: hypothetical protein CMO20_05405 [Thermoplasmata archaeon]|nr:hypothetical protein [Thermoplasmata archaeon]
MNLELRGKISESFQSLVGQYKEYMDDRYITDISSDIADMCWGVVSSFLPCHIKDKEVGNGTVRSKFKSKLKLEIESGFPSTIRERTAYLDVVHCHYFDMSEEESLNKQLNYLQEAEDNFSPSIKGGMGVMLITDEIEKFTSLFMEDMKKMGVDNWDTRMGWDGCDVCNPITAMNIIHFLTTRMLEPLGV